jgi:hypothetical protein
MIKQLPLASGPPTGPSYTTWQADVRLVQQNIRANHRVPAGSWVAIPPRQMSCPVPVAAARTYLHQQSNVDSITTLPEPDFGALYGSASEPDLPAWRTPATKGAGHGAFNPIKQSAAATALAIENPATTYSCDMHRPCQCQPRPGSIGAGDRPPGRVPDPRRPRLARPRPARRSGRRRGRPPLHRPGRCPGRAQRVSCVCRQASHERSGGRNVI